MRGLLILGVVVLLGTLGGRWAMIAYEDAGLREDVLFLPAQIGSSTARAETIAKMALDRARQHHCEPIVDGVVVQVHDATNEPMAVQGMTGSVNGPGPRQLVDITLSCTRRGPFFTNQTLVTTLRTSALGVGTANRYPPLSDADRYPTELKDPAAPPR